MPTERTLLFTHGGMNNEKNADCKYITILVILYDLYHQS